MYLSGLESVVCIHLGKYVYLASFNQQRVEEASGV